MDSDKEPQQETREVALDSEDMDPKEALFGGSDVCVTIPVPNAKIFNNLAEYYSKTFAKKNEKRTEENFNKQLSAAASTSSRFASLQQISKPDEGEEGDKSRKRRHTKSAPKSVLDKMQECHGPSSLLYRSIGEAVRILVRRRKACFLKEERFSWITGQLIAFDKHLNVALQNASEEYLHQPKGTTQPIRIRKCTKQLLVRGDNIVLVSHSP